MKLVNFMSELGLECAVPVSVLVGKRWVLQKSNVENLMKGLFTKSGWG